jgi:hypothetical protein
MREGKQSLLPLPDAAVPPLPPLKQEQQRWMA